MPPSAATFHTTVPNPHVSARHPMARRHTTYLAPSPVAGPRREARQLRSSPLAGPSLALSDDGILTGSDESAGQERRFKPSRISSTPDVSTSTLMNLEERVAASAPSSPAGTLRGAPPPDLMSETSQHEPEDMPTPPSPARTSSVRRLSLGLKRLSALPGMPRLSASGDATPTSPSVSLSRVRSQTGSDSTSKSGSGVPPVPPMPPVPSIPVWAKPSYIPEAVTSKSAVNAAAPTRTVLRRPVTAPSPTSLTPGSLSRRSSKHGSHETLSLPDSGEASPPIPSTSRNPELNWLSTAAPPKFSRLSLKSEGVVLPLTAKEVRRRSTIRVSSIDGADARSITGTLRSMCSQASLQSLAASTEAAAEVDDVQPPRPAFFRKASSSSSSVASTASVESDEQTTPSLSRASSSSGASIEEMRTPRVPDQDEFGALASNGAGKDKGTAGVELRVNDVTVEIIGLSEKTERVRTQEVRIGADAKPVKNAEKAKWPAPERRGTLKRMWKKLTGGGKG
ncbi:uncharacterized protein PHACADRAFT_254124 [Phanerochaete carnosa HHB-10118-sp]|uniref:Uncharacterized protein n=1 Tax=Phanerochaete carnosa (strain HHB-10118-sp) TaxID=650164 RepID=K5V2Q1_PHACS|nr:uncharacterized protein PHACADRAFT_254124 [Phanerochaete carnosa HHB-10118-sp]EKM56801.1 hypothetical protein PHACADRAFT_254124 [Phanerochaete carnosa HHB-10118-sp]